MESRLLRELQPLPAAVNRTSYCAQDLVTLFVFTGIRIEPQDLSALHQLPHLSSQDREAFIPRLSHLPSEIDLLQDHRQLENAQDLVPADA